ncbi:MAG: hypothetical protein HFJ48_00055 [Clostridia bacterium]|nr:hypothetical protein [Clostridia bacterium]
MNEENELIVEEDVPETSEKDEQAQNISGENNDIQEQITGTAQEVVQHSPEDIEKEITERANKLFEENVENRLIRDRVKREKEHNKEISKYKQLENIMKTGLGVENIDEAISKASEFYKEQGINIPTYNENSSYSERDEKILAEADAREIISFGKQEMEAEANRIASIPEDKRTYRDKILFNELCRELINLRDVENLKNKGYETEILNTKEFTEFRQQFNINTPIEKIVDMYKQMNNFKVERPKSPGSAKSTSTVKQIKDYYSPEDFDKLTDEDLNNPNIMKIVDKSRLQWFKNKEE